MTRNWPKFALIALDGEIDSGIPTDLLTDLSWEDAVMQLFRQANYAIQMNRPDSNQPQTKQFQDRMRDAIHIAMVWIGTFCIQSGASPKSIAELDRLETMGELLQHSLDYSAMCDGMNILWQGWQHGIMSGNNSVRFEYKTLRAKEFDMTDFALGVPEKEPDPDQVNAMMEYLLERCVLTVDGPYSAVPNIPNHVLQHVKETWMNLFASPWDLEPSWSLGPYRLAEFRKFWESLLTFSFVYSIMCGRARGSIEYPFDTVVPVYEKSEWLKKFEIWTGLPRGVLESILLDLTYDHALCVRRSNKKSDAVYQPFVNMPVNALALNTDLVIGSNAERNIWDLLSILRPGEFSELSRQKESHWLKSLKPDLEGLGLKCERIELGRSGDVDLLILDPMDRFGVAAELKWLMPPDRIKEHHVEPIAHAMEQSQRSIDWLHARPNEMAQKLSIPLEEFLTYQLQPLVLTKNHTMAGYCIPQVPIINEPLLMWSMRSPHRRSLRATWEFARDEKYRFRSGIDFGERQRSVTFGRVTFLFNDMPLLRNWDPASRM